MSGEHRRRDGLRRYSFTYASKNPIVDAGVPVTYSFYSASEEWALDLARRLDIFKDLQDGKIVSFEWAKYLRS